ncbi:hypothetical protein HY382_01535 [Candidatus Curtissbacteria bacterium]|nr:hypothetical protein [Candidatus Curtissbacteria bacterium]
MKNLEKFGIDRNFLISGAIALVAVAVILVIFKDSTTRFTFVMPVFAGFIFYNILTSKDLDKEDDAEEKSKSAAKGKK